MQMQPSPFHYNFVSLQGLYRSSIVFKINGCFINIRGTLKKGILELLDRGIVRQGWGIEPPVWSPAPLESPMTLLQGFIECHHFESQSATTPFPPLIYLFILFFFNHLATPYSKDQWNQEKFLLPMVRNPHTLTLKEPGGAESAPLHIFFISQPVVIFSRWNFMTFFFQALRSI